MSIKNAMDFLIPNSGAHQAQTGWTVELLRTDCIWYDMHGEHYDDQCARRDAIFIMNQVRQSVQTDEAKRFGYYLYARSKIRFLDHFFSKFSFFKKELMVDLSIGNDEVRRLKLRYLALPSGVEAVENLEINLDEKRMYVRRKSETKEDMQILTVHEFLQLNHIVINNDSEVYGIDSLSAGAPQNGFADALNKASDEDTDCFIIVCAYRLSTFLFKKNAGMVLSNGLQQQELSRKIEHNFIAYLSNQVNRDKIWYKNSKILGEQESEVYFCFDGKSSDEFYPFSTSLNKQAKLIESMTKMAEQDEKLSQYNNFDRRSKRIALRSGLLV